jgi:hypothetical protein
LELLQVLDTNLMQDLLNLSNNTLLQLVTMQDRQHKVLIQLQLVHLQVLHHRDRVQLL